MVLKKRRSKTFISTENCQAIFRHVYQKRMKIYCYKYHYKENMMFRFHELCVKTECVRIELTITKLITADL